MRRSSTSNRSTPPQRIRRSSSRTRTCRAPRRRVRVRHQNSGSRARAVAATAQSCKRSEAKGPACSTIPYRLQGAPALKYRRTPRVGRPATPAPLRRFWLWAGTAGRGGWDGGTLHPWVGQILLK
eukprot:scaffold89410_cov33-Phaeocystis_antarctica.AAC.1